MEVVRSRAHEARFSFSNMIDYAEQDAPKVIYVEYREEDGTATAVDELRDVEVAMAKPNGDRVLLLLTPEDSEENFAHVWQSKSGRWYRVTLIQRFPYGVRSAFEGAAPMERLFTTSGAVLATVVMGVGNHDGFVALKLEAISYRRVKQLWLQYSKKCAASGCTMFNCLKKCGGCGIARYCSRKHQSQHWRSGHKRSCCVQQPMHAVMGPPLTHREWLTTDIVVSAMRSKFYVPNYKPRYLDTTTINLLD